MLCDWPHSNLWDILEILIFTTDCSIYLINTKAGVHVTGQQGMCNPPRHLIPSLACPGLYFYPILLILYSV